MTKIFRFICPNSPPLRGSKSNSPIAISESVAKRASLARREAKVPGSSFFVSLRAYLLPDVSPNSLIYAVHPIMGRDRTERGHRPLGRHLRHWRNRNPADGLLPRRDLLSFGSSQAGSVHAVASIQNNSGPSQGLAGRPAAG